MRDEKRRCKRQNTHNIHMMLSVGIMRDGRWKPQAQFLCLPAKNYRFIFHSSDVYGSACVFLLSHRSTLFVTRSAFNRKHRDFVRVTSGEYYERDDCLMVCVCVRLSVKYVFVPAHLVSGCVQFAWIFWMTLTNLPKKKIAWLSPVLNDKEASSF